MKMSDSDLERKNDVTISQRAAECIRKRASETGTSFQHQVDLLGTSMATVKYWKRGKGNITSYYLAEMYKHGYDVIYILTGENGMNTGGDLHV